MRHRHTYSTGQVVAFTGATARQVDYWCRRGIITPSVKDTAGIGYPRRFSWADVEVVWALRFIAGHVGRIDAPDALAALTDHIHGRGLHGVVRLVPAVSVDLDELRRALERRLPVVIVPAEKAQEEVA